MKKGIVLALSLLLIVAANAFAEHDANYEAMKKYKAEQREAKKNAASNPAASHEKTFWEKEGDRSGLGDSGNRMGGFLKNLNPVPFFKSQQEAYNARKAGGVK